MNSRKLRHCRNLFWNVLNIRPYFCYYYLCLDRNIKGPNLRENVTKVLFFLSFSVLCNAIEFSNFGHVLFMPKPIKCRNVCVWTPAIFFFHFISFEIKSSSCSVPFGCYVQLVFFTIEIHPLVLITNILENYDVSTSLPSCSLNGEWNELNSVKWGNIYKYKYWNDWIVILFHYWVNERAGSVNGNER